MRYFEINDLSPDERKALAKKANVNAVYLWQCGAGIKVPSLHLADDLLRLETRLTVPGLLAPWRRRQSQQRRKGMRK